MRLAVGIFLLVVAAISIAVLTRKTSPGTKPGRGPEPEVSSPRAASSPTPSTTAESLPTTEVSALLPEETVGSKPPPPPPATRAVAPPPAPKPPPAAAERPKPRQSCDPPFTILDNGVKEFKPECF
jgi:hypothetical protein